jgi:hypothetical protein
MYKYSRIFLLFHLNLLSRKILVFRTLYFLADKTINLREALYFSNLKLFFLSLSSDHLNCFQKSVLGKDFVLQISSDLNEIGKLTEMEVTRKSRDLVSCRVTVGGFFLSFF